MPSIAPSAAVAAEATTGARSAAGAMRIVDARVAVVVAADACLHTSGPSAVRRNAYGRTRTDRAPARHRRLTRTRSAERIGKLLHRIHYGNNIDDVSPFLHFVVA